MTITKGTRVRCELESRGKIIEIEGQVVETHGARFADVALGIGGTLVTLPTADLHPLSAEIVPFRPRTVDDVGFDLTPGGSAA